jgi:hypothetical protein
MTLPHLLATLFFAPIMPLILVAVIGMLVFEEYQDGFRLFLVAAIFFTVGMLLLQL